MRYNFEEEDGGRQSEDVEWLPLQHHPVFSTPPDRDRDGDRALTMPKNLLAWDGASRLYFWDSYKTCLHRLSVRLGEPDPTSLLAASPSKVLQADVQLNSEVQRISINRNGSALFLVGLDGLYVMYLYGRTSTKENTIICRQRRDKLIWRHSRDGSYTVKACYLQQSSKKTVIDQWPWKLIWRTKLPPKVICFSWITLKDSCLTQNNLMRRKFQIVNRCYMCLCNSESINHLFLHCTVATGLWNMFFSLFGLTWVIPRSLREAFVCWSSWKVGKSVKHIWSLVPACILWCLWTERNKRCFDGTPTPISTFKARCLITHFGWVNLSPVLSVDSFLEFISSIDLCC